MQVVWGKGHSVNEVLRQLFLFLFAKITSERDIYSCNDFPTKVGVPCIVVRAVHTVHR